MAVNMTEEQLQRLLKAVGDGQKGSMATCNASYDGKKDRETLEAFLTAIRIFKGIYKISDQEAIEGLPLVFRAEAAVWWQGTKDTVNTWEEFETIIRDTFAPKKETYLLYIEACRGHQPPDSACEVTCETRRVL
ncbi:activity-regulated cytoskeleton associated protein 2-like [Pectinophora gossypiella]|uniref:activity-regulated cytoskeleton associated protein 2-like n=1 Tax=Pectinophora gossypiella TaxID=13191 RepID=UPI00214E77A6|nr:activity-regulated cytoskeleton associated protein 2-like [Pectinophora gossypiella]